MPIRPARAVSTPAYGYGKLHLIAYFRSWDLWAGFPFSLAAMQLLKEYAGQEIGVDGGEIIAVSKGTHLHDYSWELARTAAKERME